LTAALFREAQRQAARSSAQQHRALQLLAGVSFGATEASMFANGFARKTLVSLIRARLATTQRENLKAGSRSIGRVRITEAGRRALQGC
jgi:hypothetical protein